MKIAWRKYTRLHPYELDVLCITSLYAFHASNNYATQTGSDVTGSLHCIGLDGEPLVQVLVTYVWIPCRLG